MLVTVVAEDVHHVLLIGALFVAHFAGLAVGVFLDGLEHLAAAADIENAADLIERLLVDAAQGSGPVAHVDGRELPVDLLVVVVDPLPDGSLFGVEFGFDKPRNEAVARAEDILADNAFQGELLAALLALDEEAEFLRQRAQRLNDIPRGVAARAARAARHALAAIPDRIALQQRLDGIVIAGLDDRDDLPRVVVVELGRGADARTDAAVHAGLQPFAHPHVLHQHVEILSHTFYETKKPLQCKGRQSARVARWYKYLI